jgi:hypothetical protein
MIFIIRELAGTCIIYLLSPWGTLNFPFTSEVHTIAMFLTVDIEKIFIISELAGTCITYPISNFIPNSSQIIAIRLKNKYRISADSTLSYNLKCKIKVKTCFRLGSITKHNFNSDGDTPTSQICGLIMLESLIMENESAFIWISIHDIIKIHLAVLELNTDKERERQG